MTTAQVRSALGTAIRTVTYGSLRAAEYAPDVINTPMATVMAGEYDPRMVMGQAKSERTFQVKLWVERAPAETSQKLLDAYCEMVPPGTGGTLTSVVSALQEYSYSSAVLDYVEVTNVSGLEITEWNAIEYLTRTLNVEVVY